MSGPKRREAAIREPANTGQPALRRNTDEMVTDEYLRKHSCFPALQLLGGRDRRLLPPTTSTGAQPAGGKPVLIR